MDNTRVGQAVIELLGVDPDAGLEHVTQRDPVLRALDWAQPPPA